MIGFAWKLCKLFLLEFYLRRKELISKQTKNVDSAHFAVYSLYMCHWPFEMCTFVQKFTHIWMTTQISHSIDNDELFPLLFLFLGSSSIQCWLFSLKSRANKKNEQMFDGRRMWNRINKQLIKYSKMVEKIRTFSICVKISVSHTDWDMT